MRSAFNGHIDEIPFILVDNFENDLNKNAYFLSHFHGDHVFGLGEDRLRHRLKRNKAFIYASEVTVAIIKKECPLLYPYLKVLELGRNTISITYNEKEIFLNVITLPAGHSFGSTMFLFQHENKNILYTGDFRITRNSVAKYTHLHHSGDPITLDVLYVDTTFQNIPTFPKRSDVVRNAAVHIKNWLNLSKEHRVVLLTSAGYGYEVVCNVIFEETGMKTYVDGFHWDIYSQFPKELYGTTNDPQSPISLCTKYRHTKNSDPLELQVYFSALKWGDKQNLLEEYLAIKQNRIEVCFSTHCGRDELLHFINYFKPNKIVGFPNEFDKYNVVDFLNNDFDDEVENVKILPKKRRVMKKAERVGKRVKESVLNDVFEF